jgi:hypothetical protein
MLTKRKLRALVPRHWARVIVPDLPCWRKEHNIGPGSEVDIAMVPSHEPKYDYPNYWQWHCRVAYRRPGSNYVHFEHDEGGRIGYWDFRLIDPSQSNPNWDKQTMDEHFEGKGTWLYEPASDDPELCPGGDWSRYECSLCGKFVKPFSNDAGDLLCPTCEVTGLVILDDEQLDRLEQVREFARSIGLSEQLERQLNYLHGYGSHDDAPKRQCVLGYDFAPHSFSFARYVLPTSSKDGTRKFWFNGAMIWQGPSCPADGSFPSLTVSLAEGTGWFCHT